MKTYVHAKAYAWMLTAGLHKRAPNWRQHHASINYGIDKPTTGHSLHEIPLSNKKELTDDSCSKMYEPQE